MTPSCRHLTGTLKFSTLPLDLLLLLGQHHRMWKDKHCTYSSNWGHVYSRCRIFEFLQWGWVCRKSIPINMLPNRGVAYCTALGIAKKCHTVTVNFCLGTGVPRHSAGGVGLLYVRGTVVHNAHVGVMEAENPSLLLYTAV